MADPERGLWERQNFKEVPRYLKSYRISLAYGITSNKDQASMKRSCFFSCYIEEYVDFVPFSVTWGAWPHLAPLDPPLKVMSPHPRAAGSAGG